MISISHHHFELLKKQLLAILGYKSISPADCKVIAALVSNQTKHSVSETTIKRLYGFALSKFNPSLFTLDVIARYCNYDGWQDFCDRHITEQYELNTADIDWETLRRKAWSITDLTLQTIRNRAGMPYNYTIKREAVETHLSEFVQGDFIGAILSAPTGYGKTIALTHWIAEKRKLNITGNDKDAFLFLSGNALVSALQNGRTLTNWLLGLLGYGSIHDINSLINKKQVKDNKFYLIIDGLDEHMFAHDQFNLIIKQVTALFSLYKHYNCFKLILTMRSSTWINSRHYLEADDNKWFTGFKTGSGYGNVPLFSYKEVMQLCYKINPLLQSGIQVKEAHKLSHPLFFQYFYMHHRGNLSVKSMDKVSLYELLSVFMLNKVYLGKNATEKVQIIKSLVKLMDMENMVYRVDKLNISALLKQYSPAYHELLGIGVIKEYNAGHINNHRTYIAFNNNFLEHSIAKSLFLLFDDKFEKPLIDHINKIFSASPYKLSVVKWCLVFASKTEQHASLENLKYINLSSAEKAELVIFLGDLLQSGASAMERNDTLIKYFNQDFSGKMLEFFFGLALTKPQ